MKKNMHAPTTPHPFFHSVVHTRLEFCNLALCLQQLFVAVQQLHLKTPVFLKTKFCLQLSTRFSLDDDLSRQKQKSIRYLHRDGEVVSEERFVLSDLLDFCFHLLALQVGLLLELVHLLHQLRSDGRELLFVVLFKLPVRYMKNTRFKAKKCG